MHASEPVAGAADHLATLIPHLAAFEAGRIDDHRTYVVIHASLPGQATANCPACGMSSSRVHGRYRRLLQDLPAGGRAVLIALTIRRLRCGNPACKVRTFAEPVGDLAARRARTTSPLRRMLEPMALALAGRAGSRLLALLGVTISRDTLIRLIRALPEPEVGPVTVLGIDEWAKRKGRSYATVLVNMETGHPIDILEDCLTETVTIWLHRHPEIQVICRDRAGAFAEAAGTGAPQATQVADRWHLWHNLCRAAEGVIRTHRRDLRKSTSSAEPQLIQTFDTTTAAPAPPTASTTVVGDEPGSVTAAAAARSPSSCPTCVNGSRTTA